MSGPTPHQQALQQHVAAFARRHGYEEAPVTVADLGDETFGLLETRSAVYLFSLPHDGTLVDVMSLYGESAVLVFLALAKLLNNGRLRVNLRGLVPQEHRHRFDEMTPRRGSDEIPAEVLRITTAAEVEGEQEVDGRWIAEITDLPGCMVYGDTEGEAVTECKRLASDVEGEVA